MAFFVFIKNLQLDYVSVQNNGSIKCWIVRVIEILSSGGSMISQTGVPTPDLGAKTYYDCPQKLWEGNAFTGVSVYGEGLGDSGPSLERVCISGTKSLLGVFMLRGFVLTPSRYIG